MNIQFSSAPISGSTTGHGIEVNPKQTLQCEYSGLLRPFQHVRECQSSLGTVGYITHNQIKIEKELISLNP